MIVSSSYQNCIKLYQSRNKKEVLISDVLIFNDGYVIVHIIEELFTGDIIGLYNHGDIQIGNTFTKW
ncbi:MAG: hypothetical protein ACEY3J_03290 [Arsenophonus sp.]